MDLRHGKLIFDTLHAVRTDIGRAHLQDDIAFLHAKITDAADGPLMRESLYLTVIPKDMLLQDQCHHLKRDRKGRIAGNEKFPVIRMNESIVRLVLIQ